MKKWLCILIFLLSSVVSINAVEILVWVYDPGGSDKWQDPEAGKQINCGFWLQETLKHNGYSSTYHYGLKMPADISSYDLIVATTGFFYC